MDAKQFLLQYAEAERIIARLAAEYDKQLEMVDNIRSPLSGDGTPRGSGISRPTEVKAAELEKKTDEYKAAQLEALRVRQKVLDVVQQVPGIMGEVLYERYINLKDGRLQTMEEVAAAINYSKRRADDFHADALDYINNCVELHNQCVVYAK